MANVHTDVSRLSGLFKQVYANDIVNLIPSEAVLTKMSKFVSKEKELGDVYNQPFRVKLPQGTTRHIGGQAFNLNDAVAGQIVNAQVSSSEYVLRDMLSYAAASRASQSRNAFMDATQSVVEGMRIKIARDIESDLLYGQAGLGVVEAVDTTNKIVTIKAGEFAPGLWTGAEGMKLATWANVSGDVSPTCALATIVGVDVKARKLTLDTVTGIAVNNHIFEFGAYGNTMAGLHKIATNTGSLFGLNWAGYSILKPVSYAINNGGTAQALSFAAIGEAMEEALNKGLSDEVVLLTSHAAWHDLHREVISRRDFDSSYSTAQVDVGSKSIRYFYPNGVIKIVSSPFVKRGYSYITAEKDLLRIGSTDVTFKRPGQGGETFFRDLENNAGFELRAYSDQSLFHEAPGKLVVLTNIAPGVV